MTREQYHQIAENFADYAKAEVSYKSTNTCYGRGFGENSQKKYNTKVGTLRGVGILGNAEHFLIQANYGVVAIHYTRVAYPKH